MHKLAYPLLCGLLAENPTTLSYAMHSGAYGALGLPHTYSCFSTTDTKSALDAMRSLGIRGLSLTIPHKEAAIPFLDELDEAVLKIGAVNTVVNDEGQLKGYNTDWIGVTEAFKEAGVTSLKGKSVAMIGAGGAARAGILALKGLSVSDVTVFNRNVARAEVMAKDLGVKVGSFEELANLQTPAVIVNSSPIGSSASGLQDQLPPVSLDGLNSESVVFDMVTHPTRLTKQAEEAGSTVIVGSRMLLFQAVAQFELFIKREIDPKVMDKALTAELERSGLS